MGVMELKCVNNCEFLKFKDHNFHCDLYEEDLYFGLHELELRYNTKDLLKFIAVQRCGKCIKDRHQYEVIKDLDYESKRMGLTQEA